MSARFSFGMLLLHISRIYLSLRLDRKRAKAHGAAQYRKFDGEMMTHTSDHSAEVNSVIESIENARHEAVVALLTTTVCFALNSKHHHHRGNEQNE